MDSMGPGCTVKFDGGVIKVIGNGIVPDDIRMNAIDEIKPAHLPTQPIGNLFASSKRYLALTCGVYLEIHSEDAK